MNIPAMEYAETDLIHLELKRLFSKAMSKKGISIRKRALLKKLPRSSPVKRERPRSTHLLMHIFWSVTVILERLNSDHLISCDTIFHLQLRI